MTLAILVSAGTTAGCTAKATPPPPKPRPTVSATAGCPASGVRLTAGEIDGAMGLRVDGVELVNCGSKPYTLDGYPAVRVLDASHERLAVTVSHGAEPIWQIDGFDPPAKPVTLPPGGTAEFGVVWRNTVTDPTTVTVQGAYLAVTPMPGQPEQLVPIHLDLGNSRLGISSRQRYQASPTPGAPAATGTASGD